MIKGLISHPGRYFGNSAQFWLDFQSEYDIAMVEREKGGDYETCKAGRRGVSF